MTLTYTNNTSSGDIAWKQWREDFGVGGIDTYPPGQHPLNRKMTRQQIQQARGIKNAVVTHPEDLVEHLKCLGPCREAGHEIRVVYTVNERILKVSHTDETGLRMAAFTQVAVQQAYGGVETLLGEWLRDLPEHPTLTIGEKVVHLPLDHGEWLDDIQGQVNEAVRYALQSSSESIPAWAGDTVNLPHIQSLGPVTITVSNTAPDAIIDVIWGEG